MTIRSLIILLLCGSLCQAQHDWQKPKPLIAKSKLEQIIGPVTKKALSKKVHVVWVWGYDKGHKPGAHDYLRVRDLMVGLLGKVPNVTVESAYLFPTKEQFEKADLVAMYLHLPQLTADQYANFKSFIRGGGGVVALHETAIIRPAAEGKKLAQCLGMAWDEGRSKWGAIFEDISIRNDHEIFKGFGDKLRIVDEFYWQLNQIEGVSVLGSVRTGPPTRSRGPIAATKLSKLSSPMFWTLETGNGRVFGTTTGHNTFSYYDPEFRIVLFRAMAWAIKEKADPFMPLVFDGITNDKGLVGTTDNMRNWKGKLRAPPKAAKREARPRFKGVELYSWQNDGGDWQFVLLDGTNRLKSAKEVKESPRVTGAEKLKRAISSLAAGEYVSWNHRQAGFKYPSEALRMDIAKMARQAGIKLSLPN